MKSLEELYEEVRNSQELVGAFTKAVEDDRLEGFLKEQGCSASPEEAQAFLTAQMGKTQALSDEELDNVAGGKDHSRTVDCPNCKKIHTYRFKSYKDMKKCPYCGYEFIIL